MNYFVLFIKKLLRYLLKPLSFLPAICMMYVIFSFSAQTGDASGRLSGKISFKVVETVNEIADWDMSESELKLKADKIEFYVRKAAHITEYFLLAVSIAVPLYVYRLRGFALVIVAGFLCVGFAGLDEYHQSFVSGRSPSGTDVAIDSIGIFIGIFVTRIFGYLGRKTIFKPLSLEKPRDEAYEDFEDEDEYE